MPSAIIGATLIIRKKHVIVVVAARCSTISLQRKRVIIVVQSSMPFGNNLALGNNRCDTNLYGKKHVITVVALIALIPYGETRNNIVAILAYGNIRRCRTIHSEKRVIVVQSSIRRY